MSACHAANIARTSATFRKAEVLSDIRNRSTVFLPCPGSFTRHCQYYQRMWLCEKCRHTLQYAYDGYFYCDCGRAPSESFTFKCNSARHGEPYDAFDDITESLAKMKSVKEINILVLGETGIGKSTWINAFYKYVSYATFEQAEKAESLVYAIPSRHQATGHDRRP